MKTLSSPCLSPVLLAGNPLLIHHKFSFCSDKNFNLSISPLNAKKLLRNDSSTGFDRSQISSFVVPLKLILLQHRMKERREFDGETNPGHPYYSSGLFPDFVWYINFLGIKTLNNYKIKRWVITRKRFYLNEGNC